MSWTDEKVEKLKELWTKGHLQVSSVKFSNDFGFSGSKFLSNKMD